MECASVLGFTSDRAKKPRNDTRCDSLNCVSCSNGTNIEVKQGWRLHMAGDTAAVLRCPNPDACEQRYKPGSRMWRRKHALSTRTMHNSILTLVAKRDARTPRFSAKRTSTYFSFWGRKPILPPQKRFLESIRIHPKSHKGLHQHFRVNLSREG